MLTEIKLIPVLEVFYAHPPIESPTLSPYWRYPEAWDTYHQIACEHTGFVELGQPYLAGSLFYEFDKVSDNNLTRLIERHLQPLLDEEIEIDESLPLNGGYVLNINGEDKYFPQCCADLSTIWDWEGLIFEPTKYLWNGHPQPLVAFDKDTIMLDFSDTKYESFCPPPSEIFLKINKLSLQYSVEKAKEQLRAFAQRLQTLQLPSKLNSPNLYKILTGGNSFTK